MSEDKKISIKDRPQDLQPRERLMSEGAGALSNAELFAILLNTGTSEKNVLELAEDVLLYAGGLEGMLGQSIKSLCTIKGIGPAKATTLLAAVEIARRILKLERRKKHDVIDSAAAAAVALRVNLQTAEQEAFQVLYLDVKNRLLGTCELFRGTVNGTNVHPRDVFREAVKYNAVSVIVGHNHPSGDIRPSSADEALTRRLAEAGKIMGIPLLDHVIVSDWSSEDYFSFKEKDLLGHE